MAFIPEPNRAMDSRWEFSSPYSSYRTYRSATRENAGRTSWARTSSSRPFGATRNMPSSAGAALATVVGVLVEVPVMLLVVKIVTATRG